MQTDAELAAIARSLSVPEKVALLRHPKVAPYGSPNRGWPQSGKDPTSFCHAGRALMDRKLLKWFGDTSATVMLPLGLRVAQHLKQENAK